MAALAHLERAASFMRGPGATTLWRVARGVAAIDGGVFREVMVRFGEALEAHREEIDSLNVFPVPDGDTGTNLALTQRAVRDALEQAGSSDLRDAGRVVARAALMGARGNSGVILAQVLHGLSEGLGNSAAADARALAESLERASAEARRAVARPVEGTALTVLGDAAGAARRSQAAGSDLAATALAALEAARRASDRTHEMIPELSAAGVVDAGGRGMVLLFDAFAAVLGGGRLTEPVGPSGPVGRVQQAEPQPLRQRYEVVYLWEGSDERLPEISRALNELGDSVVVVGGSGLFKIHVHTNVPDEAVAAAGPGGAHDLQVVDLEAQVAEHCVAGQARAVRMAEQQAAALVAVSDGDGLAEIFRSLGAVVVRGGPGSNPAVGELVEAVEASPASSALILPNHPNVLPASERAARESSKDVRVIPTSSVVAGLSAAAAFNPMVPAQENEEPMRDVAKGFVHLEVTRAVRDAATPAGPVRRGDWLGLAGGDIVAAGRDPERIAVKLVANHRSPNHEVLTLVLGVEASDDEAAGVEAALRESTSDLEIQVHRGGQPHHPYLIGLE
jgi:uncharacterized protein